MILPNPWLARTIIWVAVKTLTFKVVVLFLTWFTGLLQSNWVTIKYHIIQNQIFSSNITAKQFIMYSFILFQLDVMWMVVRSFVLVLIIYVLEWYSSFGIKKHHIFCLHDGVRHYQLRSFPVVLEHFIEINLSFIIRDLLLLLFQIIITVTSFKKLARGLALIKTFHTFVN